MPRREAPKDVFPRSRREKTPPPEPFPQRFTNCSNQQHQASKKGLLRGLRDQQSQFTCARKSTSRLYLQSEANWRTGRLLFEVWGAPGPPIHRAAAVHT